MLTKAILTGGVLSLLAGSIVYFGTEGADATELETNKSIDVRDTELAGAAKDDTDDNVVDVRDQEILEMPVTVESSEDLHEKAETAIEVEVEEERDSETTILAMSDPKAEQPQKKWLDQYLKSTRPSAKPDAEMEKIVEEEGGTDPVDLEVAIEPSNAPEIISVPETIEVEVEDEIDQSMMLNSDASEKSDETHGSAWKSQHGKHMMEDQSEILPDLLENEEKREIKTRIIIKDKASKARAKAEALRAARMAVRQPAFDYGRVLAEAKKLQVIDMRDQAMLEIIDYAIDRQNIDKASVIMVELSSPELRDTARARIGKALATCGDMDAAFAILDELEIDELTAPIRLEIIAALTATRQERAAPPMYRHQKQIRK